MSALAVAGQVAVVLGAAIFVVTAIGLWRLPDVFTRISSVATAAGLGVVLVTGGAVLTAPTIENGLKVVVAVLLQLVTSAVGGMTIARAAVASRHRFADGTDGLEVLEVSDVDPSGPSTRD